MMAKKGMIMGIGDKRLLVDDVQRIQGEDYVVFYSLDEKIFCIAKEVVENDNPRYDFLNYAEAIKIANEIDKVNANK